MILHKSKVAENSSNYALRRNKATVLHQTAKMKKGAVSLSNYVLPNKKVANNLSIDVFESSRYIHMIKKLILIA